jgi:membrane protein DedA with SNARE-associated domain
METFIHLLDQYGYIILFLSLMLELIALPIPTEPLMSYVGYLIYQHQLNLFVSILAASFGSYCGMTIAYWIGYKLGYPFFNRYGNKFHLGPERLQKVEGIFRKHGAKFLLVSCFIPGVRHLSGYFTGISRLSYRSFSIFSGLGVLIWTTSFISLGDILGPQWMLIEKSLKKYMILAAVLIVMALLLVFVIKRYLESIKTSIVRTAKGIYSGYRVRFRLKLLITCILIVFIIFVSFSVGLIQDYFGHDFGDFNKVSLIVFWDIFRKGWEPYMKAVMFLGSKPLLIGLVILSAIWSFVRSRDRLLEVQCLTLLVVGGFIYIEGIRRLFSWLSHAFGWTITGVPAFPNDQLILAVMIYGFSAFIVSRHILSHLLKLFILIVVLCILFAVGLAGVYYGVQPPSGIIAGYLFGAVWLSFVLLILEIARLIRGNVTKTYK